jgi:nicotinamidase-related amidase
LERLQPEKLIVCGVATNVCVLHTTSDARNRDYQVDVPSDCVATFDADAHVWAMGHLRSILGARIVDPA